MRNCDRGSSQTFLKVNWSALLGLIVASVVAFPALAAEVMPAQLCEEVAATQRPKLALTTTDRAKIADKFADSSVERRDQLQAAFDIYLKARLRVVPGKLKRQAKENVQSFLDNIQVHEIGPLEASGAGMSVPRILDGTAAPFVIMVHEIEHHIDIAQWMQTMTVEQMQQSLEDAVNIYRSESRAMQAEWEFLSALPKEVRQELIKRVHRNDNVADRDKGVLLPMFFEVPADPMLYVHRQHEFGRYDWKNCQAAANHNRQRP